TFVWSRYMTGKRAKELRHLDRQLIIVNVIEDMLRNATGIHCGVAEKLMPVVGVGLEAELLRPFAERFVVAWRRHDFAFDFAPIAGVVLVFQTKLTQAESLFCPKFFDECAKHRFLICGI